MNIKLYHPKKRNYNESDTCVMHRYTINFILHTLYFLFACFICTTLTSCVDATSGRRFENDYIVIAGSIYADEPIFDYPISIGKTSDLNDIKLIDLILYNAFVAIKDLESNSETKLEFDPLKKGYIDKHKTLIIEGGKTYRLTVIFEDEMVWAETTVPHTYELIVNHEDGYTIDSNRDNFPKIPHSEIDLKYPIKLKVIEPSEIRVRVEYFCMEEYEDVYFVPPFSDYIGERPVDKKDYDGNEYDPGMRKNISTHSLFPNDAYMMTLPLHQFHFWFYGDYKITINIIDENYYRYLYKTNGYFHGGISKGGIGYFGSGTSKVVYTRVM